MLPGVVRQEMLHLALAGNILCSIGGTPTIYGDTLTPKYSVYMFYDKNVRLQLKAATKENVHMFMEVR